MDILISDIGMPDEDGYSLILRIRALQSEQKPRIPAIALTAFAQEEDQQEAIATGFQSIYPGLTQIAHLNATASSRVGNAHLHVGVLRKS